MRFETLTNLMTLPSKHQSLVISKSILFLSFFLLCASFLSAQQNDTTLNNLVHPQGYPAVQNNSIPEYKIVGSGKQDVILIPGLGFDESVFEDFIDANKKKYRMCVITVPGFGKSYAPPMPQASVSYGELTWTNSAARGIAKLIEKEKLKNPMIVGHFVTGTQIAIRLAVDFPEKIGGLIILGGSAKMMGMSNGKLIDTPLAEMVKGTDAYWGPKWFKHMTKKFYDEGNFTSDIYSMDEKKGSNLWEMVSETPMPIAVRYVCEYFASDMLLEVEKIKCPMLVVRPLFSNPFWENQMNSNWIKPQFIESWNVAKKRNSSIKIVDVPESATFVWKDNSEIVYNAIEEFLKHTKSNH